MIHRHSRRAAAAVALAAALALATPAHAAGLHGWTAGPGWIDTAARWIVRLWTGQSTEWELKAGMGIDPNGATAPPAAETNSDRGSGIDPNG